MIRNETLSFFNSVDWVEVVDCLSGISLFKLLNRESKDFLPLFIAIMIVLRGSPRKK